MVNQTKYTSARSSHKCPPGTRLLKRPVKEGSRKRYCTKPRKSRRRKNPKKCPNGTRLLKHPVKEGSRTRYCTKPRKSRRRKNPKKCPNGTRLLKHPVKEGSRTRYCTKPRKSRRRKSSPKKYRRRKSSPKKPRKKPHKPKKKPQKPKGTHTCRSKIGDYGMLLGRYCDELEGGEYTTLPDCIEDCEEGQPGMKEKPDYRYSERTCMDKWCVGPLVGKKWKICYRKNSLRLHPDKNVGKSKEEQKRLESQFKELAACNTNSKYW